MELMSVGVRQIDNSTFQIIGTASLDTNMTREILIEKVVKLAEIAERNHGVSKQEFAHTMPTNVVVHATYMFQSGIDVQSFLSDCENV